MLKSKFLFAFFIFCLMAPVILVTSCGKQQVPETQVEVIGTTPEQLQRLETFDTQLSNIKDEETAKTAVTTFADYVEGPASSGAAASSVRIFSTARIDQLARLEAKGRQKLAEGGVSASSVGTEEGVLTLDNLKDSLNKAKEASVPEIRLEDIEFVQAGIRSELPHVSPGGNEWEPKVEPGTIEGSTIQALGEDEASQDTKTYVITPLEAIVIGYVIASGDNGSAGPGAFKYKLPEDKVGMFLDEVSK